MLTLTCFVSAVCLLSRLAATVWRFLCPSALLGWAASEALRFAPSVIWLMRLGT